MRGNIEASSTGVERIEQALHADGDGPAILIGHMKSTLELRPVFHRIEPRIRAHVLLCWLALLLIRVAERRTGMTWRRIAVELGHVHAVTLHNSAGTVVQTTPLNTVQQGIVDTCSVAAPPRITHLHPA